MKNLFKAGIAFISFLLVMTGCSNFHDGGSVWGDGLWLIPTITGIGTAIFGYITYKKSTSGSTIIDNGAITSREGGNIPFWKHGQFYFALALLIATILIILNVNSNK